MQVYVLRHCKTENNIKNSWCGAKTNNDLSEEGKIRNNELLKELSKINFDCIFSSPLKRCLATAKPLAKLLNCKLVIDDRLIERDFGEIEGLPCDQNDKIKLADLKLNTDLGKKVEPILDVLQKRVAPFYKDLCSIKYKKVLIVTHSWVIRLLKYIFSNALDSSVIAITPPNGNYFIHDEKKIISRSFNSIKIVDGKIIKTSDYLSKFNNEIMWMVSLPNELRNFIPEIISYNIVEKPNKGKISFIEMKYINAGSFDQKFLNKVISEKEAKKFFDQIKLFLHKAKKFKKINQDKQKTISELRDIYLIKTIDRWNKIKDDEKFINFYNKDIFINNKKYHSVKYYLEKLEQSLKNNGILEYRDFCIIHGDLCFNNILIDEDKIYLIDPRGSFGEKGLYGDQYYEIAKLAHSIDGYDCIINDMYNLDYNSQNAKINYSIINNKNKSIFKKELESRYSKVELDKIYFIESLLFLSMIPLHSEDYSHQLMMLAFAVEMISKYIK